MSDPQIPRGSGPKAPGPTWGRFIDYGNRVVLVDRAGNSWTQEKVSILQGSFGNADEGIEKLPRPWTFDASGKVVVNGDWLVIDFLDGSPLRPFVRGGIRPLPHDAFLARSHADLDQSSKGRLRARLVPRNAAGEVKGEVRLKVSDSGDGTVEVLATDAVTIEVGPDLDNGARMSVTIDQNTVTINKGGAAEFVALSTLVDAQLARLMDALTNAVIVAGDGGASFKATLLVALNAPPAWPESTAATKLKAE